jgi:hypothetical protein
VTPARALAAPDLRDWNGRAPLYIKKQKRAEHAEGNQRSSALAASIFGGLLRLALSYIKNDAAGRAGRSIAALLAMHGVESITGLLQAFDHSAHNRLKRVGVIVRQVVCHHQ